MPDFKAIRSFLALLLMAIIWLGLPKPSYAGTFSQNETIFDGLPYEYNLYVPTTLASDPAPAVMALHGGGGNAAHFESVAGLQAAADLDGFVLIMPQGFPNQVHPNQRTWNAGAFAVGAAIANIDHVAILRTIVDDVKGNIDIDPGKVYALGFSNGGMMAYRLACEASDMVAAIAVAAATLMDRDITVTPPATAFDCLPEMPVAVLHYHGLLDNCSPFFGGPGAGIVPGVRPPVSDSIWRFITLNQCNTVAIEAVGQSSCWTFGDCAESVEVEICALANHGHAWPSALLSPPGGPCSGPVSNDVGIDRIWAFFEKHARS
ncbi:MAG: PHB depolymerase family esterase [Geminicoccaceae bacterium]